MTPRDNSFDIIRHLAALLVLFSHHYALSGHPEPVFLHWDTYGTMAVIIFFSISGYLMPISFRNSQHFNQFMIKRCRRIFPGLIVCSFLMFYGIGGVFTADLPYFFSFSTFKNTVLSSVFFRHPIPGVFSDFIYPNAINGSLWTLPVEFAYYILIGALLSLSNSWKLSLLLFLSFLFFSLSLIYTNLEQSLNPRFHAHYLALFGLAFSTGAFLSMTKNAWMKYRAHLGVSAILVLLFSQGHAYMPVCGTIALSVFMIVLALSFKDRWINGKWDLSYGIYIYAFPIQQLMINLVNPVFWQSLMLSVLLTLMMAYLSYRYIERPFLRPKNFNNLSEELRFRNLS